MNSSDAVERPAARAVAGPLPTLVCACAAALLFAPSGLAAQDAPDAPPPAGEHGGAAVSAQAIPLSGDIHVDGVLDEAAWQDAQVVSGFIDGEPVEGVPAEYDTQVRILYDDQALYVGARMYDPDPGSIARQLVRRDQFGQYDWFSVDLDPNLDRRTGYVFQVSAAGVQSDRYLYDDTRRDGNWDAVWASGVQVDSLGWTAEIRIPLSQIRYEASGDPQTWGVNFERKRLANNEQSYFVLRSRLREGVVSQFGLLKGMRVAGSGRRIELKPYVLASARAAAAEPGNPFFGGTEANARTGLDLSYGLTPAFSLAATVNPDFGQVEADPAVINLSAFETFFEERRPFFVEDSQIFRFGLSGGRDNLFYSRRIGRSPHGGAPDGADFADVPTNATILGAAKVTGRTAGGLSVGALGAATDAEHGRAYFADDGSFQRFLVEPRSEYGVLRLQQDFNDGASQLGGIVTGMRRDLPGDGSFDRLPSTALSGGLSFEHQWGNRTYALWGFLAASHVRGDSTAIIDIQRSSNHYFQRPDATRLGVDSTATSISGVNWRLQLDKRQADHWTWSMWAAEVTKGFEVNDLGFSQAAERLDGGARLGYREINPGSWYREYNLNLNTFNNWSHEALDHPASLHSWTRAHTAGNVNLNGRLTFLNYWGLNGNVSWSPDLWSRGATRGGPIMKDPGSVNAHLGLDTDRRQAVNYGLDVNARHGFEGSGGHLGLSGQVSLRPSSNVQIEVRPGVSWQSDGAQYVGHTDVLPFAPTYGGRYLFADLHRTTVSMETRLNVSFSPALTLQLYAQPLLSSGNYGTYKQLAEAGSYVFDTFQAGTWVPGAGLCVGGRICRDPDGDQQVDFDGDGLPDYAFGDKDFNVRSLVGNAVLRWEYRPGSTVYLVWQRSQSDRVAVGDFDLSRDAGALWAAPADNRFILKVDYWLGL